MTKLEFDDINAEAIVQIDTKGDRSSVSTILFKFVSGYVVSQGITQAEANAWSDELKTLASSGNFFCSWTEYIFTGRKPWPSRHP